WSTRAWCSCATGDPIRTPSCCRNSAEWTPSAASAVSPSAIPRTAGPTATSQQHVDQDRQQDREQYRDEDHGQAAEPATQRPDLPVSDAHAQAPRSRTTL